MIDRPTQPLSDDVLEQSVLGAALVGGARFQAIVVSKLTIEDFVADEHKRLFRVLTDLERAGKPPDPLVVRDALVSGGMVRSRAVTAIVLATNAVTTADGVAHHVAALKELTSRRRAVRHAQDGLDALLSCPPGFVNERIASIQAALDQSRLRAERETTREVLQRIHNEAGEARTTQRPRVRAGLDAIDSALGGFKAGRLYVIAARPGVGKTSLATTIAANAVIRQRKSTHMFSLEMDAAEVLTQIACGEACVNTWRVDQGKLDDAELTRLTDSLNNLSGAPLEIDPDCDVSANDIRARVRERLGLGALDLVIVDYLQLLRDDSRAENRQVAVAEMTRSMKKLAKAASVPVILLAQLNRQIENRTDTLPRLSDLRESGAIEQDADAVLFVHRPHMRAKVEGPREQAEIIIAKNRFGPVCSRTVEFTRGWQRFYDAGV